MPDDLWANFEATSPEGELAALERARAQKRELLAALFASFDAHVEQVCHVAMSIQDRVNEPDTQPAETEQLLDELNKSWHYHGEKIGIMGKIRYDQGGNTQIHKMTETCLATSRGFGYDIGTRSGDDINPTLPYRYTALCVDIMVGDSRTEGRIRIEDLVDIIVPRSSEQLLREFTANHAELAGRIVEIGALSTEHPGRAIQQLGGLKFEADPSSPDGYALVRGASIMLDLKMFPERGQSTFNLSYRDAARLKKRNTLQKVDRRGQLTHAQVEQLRFGPVAPALLGRPDTAGTVHAYTPYIEVTGSQLNSPDTETMLVRCNGILHFIGES